MRSDPVCGDSVRDARHDSTNRPAHCRIAAEPPDNHHDSDRSGNRSGTRRSLPHRRRPCAECPWRRDTLPGQFDADRYTALADTTGTPGAEAGLTAPMFACRKSPEGAEEACAGWLAAVGHQHLGIRLAVATGRLDPRALQSAPDWPPLFDTYQEMATTQARRPSTPPGSSGAGCPRPV